jgi:hypothetical protein
MSAAAFSYSGAPLTTYAAKDTAITQRPTSTAILAIDSEDRYKTYNDAREHFTSPYSFTINKAESIMNGFFTRVGVTEVQFPWVIPNINNKTCVIVVNYNVGGPDIDYPIILPFGFYTPAALASAMQTAVRAIPQGGIAGNPPEPGLALFTMIYGIGTLGGPMPQFSYNTNNPGVTIGFSPVNPALPGYAALGITATTKQLFDVLGFDFANSFQGVQRDGGITFCQATRYVDIVCTQLTNNQALKDTMSQEVARTIMCRLYLGEPAGAQSTVSPSSATFCPPGCAPFTIYRDYASPKQIAWLPDQPIGGFLKFEVYDDNGDLLDGAMGIAAGNRSDWSLTVLVTEN